MVVSLPCMRSGAWANFDRYWPPLNGATFGEVDGWLRLGDVPDDQTDFWKAVRQQQGTVHSSRKQSVNFYVHVFRDSPALPDAYSDGAVRSFWLGLDLGESFRPFVSTVLVSKGVALLRAPAVHPGLIAPPSDARCYRLRLPKDGTYFVTA